ncbi:bacillithiol biosynthesis deacetylase BshB2 [Fredinandcohnia quinoae]|uniref:Bacillithiol biosynthesis deacetylase BshB2 n=1 Tax=Fredinandcohnia quinoae TaxID=2918902 RepID=A0AAW5E641_9BACI|nr:bacillithiol biosynthesis deacetylase BshB2 [Fredinandcohnia sp. SECRCQ15]MCH1626329.1 bacillithiol biosynthesis deacetylase BshB2 [Fredinandcohnia sp. SECRCQ15]
MERHILVVFPHPDDEAFGTAGLIGLNTKKGVPVTYACLTLGEMGRNFGKPFFANRETLPQIRKKELIDACHAMGIQDLRMLGLRDKTLEFEDPEDLADKIEVIIKETNPSLVITFYPGHGVHPDHDATGEATIRAISRLPENQRPTVYCKAITNDRVEKLGEHDIEFDVSEVQDIKLAAIKAHRSQTEGMLSRIDGKIKSQDQEVLNWINKEVYWTYKF